MKLTKVHETLKKLMYLEDDCKALDLLLATSISRKQHNSKIWIILTAKTGYGKSELTNAFDNENIIKIRKLTPSTLVSGKNDNGKHDLAPKLKNKVLLISDLAQILKLPTDTKAQLFSQLVDLYDGIASTNAYGVNKYYENLNVTFIGCSTHAIQSQFLLYSYLGTRFLCYNMDITNEQKLIQKIKQNLENQNKHKLRETYQKTVKQYIENTNYTHHKIPETIQKEIEIWGEMLTKLRTTGNTDQTSGELSETPHEELPTRIIEQLMTIYRSLKSLDLNYKDERAMQIIRNLVLSSSNRLRLKVLMTSILLQNTGQTPFTRKQISKEIGIGWKQTYRELNFLTQAQLLNKILINRGHDINGEEIYHEKWTTNQLHNNIKILQSYMGYKTKQLIKEEIIK